MQDLTGKTAVVTGAASGIGLGLAKAFAAQGMSVVLADLDPAALEKAAADVEADGVDVLAVEVDVSLAESVDALAAQSFDRFGTVHVVCNNAGVGTGGTTWEVPLPIWEWALGVNLMGVVHGIRAFVPRLIEQGAGHVVNTASIAGVLAVPMMAPYVATKFAVVGLSQTLLHDLQMAGSPVGVSVLCPAWVRTRIADPDRAWLPRLGELPEQPAGAAEGFKDVVNQLVETGLEPAVVAGMVVEAVKEDRFWVFPHPDLAEAASQRLQDAVAGINPTAKLLM